MNRGLSVYLDLMRFTAALTVFASHMTFPQFTGGIIPYQGEWAAAGVATFFVLSGYVICFVAAEKEKTFSSFAISRLARIYSVALPAIALTVGVDLVSMHEGWPRYVPAYQYAHFAKYLLTALTFTNQAGPLREPTFGNSAFWSLDYEVWYYIIFAAGAYYTGVRRAILLPCLALIAGPRAILYMPMWLTGAALYRIHSRLTVPRLVALWIFLASIVALILVRLSGLDTDANAHVDAVLHNWPKNNLSNSQNFAGDYMVASCIALNIFSARYMHFSLLDGRRVSSVITYFASFTFALYLLHRPLLDFFRYGVLGYNQHSARSIGLLVVIVLASVWLMGFVTEHRKIWWRRIFASLINRSRVFFSGRFPSAYRIMAPDSRALASG